MMTKTCCKCKKEKDVGEFCKDKRAKDGKNRTCRKCASDYQHSHKEKAKEYNAEYYKKNQDRIKKNVEEYRRENIDKIREYHSSTKYRERRKETRKKCAGNYQQENKEAHNRASREYKSRNKEKIRVKTKEYESRPEVRQHMSEYGRKYRIDNEEKIKESARKRYKVKILNESFRLKKNVSRAIALALNRVGKSKNGNSITKYLSYSIKELKEHLEKQFEPWMNWDNYGPVSLYKKNWQIDHIIPQVSFNYQTMDCEEFKRCWALENLRPLDAIENMIKGDRLQ
jgi:hypothetical protein